MILSMTGFGRASLTLDDKKLTAELKSLNSKQLDLSARIPSLYRELEPALRSDIARQLGRGKVELVITSENFGADAPVSLNLAVIEAYKRQIEEMTAKLGIDPPADWTSQLLRMPEATRYETHTLSDREANAVKEVVAKAAEALSAFRAAEGKKLEVFFREKIESIGKLLTRVEPFEAERVEIIKRRLEDQLAKLKSVEYDRGRLEQELIFYIEKLDVTEEKTRLRSHLTYFIETLEQPHDGQGKKLGFIAQEMGREINTLGSKANNADMQRIVVMMKDDLEQIKEQVLNVL